ncbi:MAG: transglycosylase domain-containing protein [bacterium]
MQEWWQANQTRRTKQRSPEIFSNIRMPKISFFRGMTRATLLKWAAIVAAVSLVVGVILVSLTFAWVAKDLPDPNSVVRRSGFSTKIVDRNGKLLYDLFTDYNRVPVAIPDIPDNLKKATIAIEDKEFYSHQGFDMLGVLRGFSRFFTRGRAQGGSTLTQQLTKNVLLTSDRSILRKLKELVLSIQIERKFSKDEILQMYLNEAPYGGTAIGIGAAAERYFGKSPKDLTLLECAVLAGMPQAPSTYSPYGSNPTAYVGRATAVLRRMREDGYINAEDEKRLVAELPNVTFQTPTHDIKAPHFVFYVKDQLATLLGDGAIEQGGYTVTTSLDLDLQDFAQGVVTEEIAKVENINITNGATMVMNPQSGEILVMVGSKNYFDDNYDGKYNVVMASRQPGSTIKPVTYAAAFAKGYSPSTMILDVPTKFPGAKEGEFYEPKNYDGKFNGPVQLRFALASSLNIPAVKILSLVGVKDMLTQAYNMGFESLEPTSANMSRFGLSVTLGGGEVRLFDLVHAYSAFANGGDKVEPVSILKVEKEGKKVYEWKGVQKSRVLTPDVAFLVNHILYDNNARLLTFGANSLLNMGGKPIAVKTGTTNDRKDNWTVGWSTNAVVGVWVGNNDNTAMKAVASGISGASPIWRKIMLKAWELYKGNEFVAPDNVEAKQVDVMSGYPEHDGYPARADYFIKGTMPTSPDPFHAKLKLCKGQNKLATDVDIARGEYEEKEFFVLKSESTNWTDDIAGWIDGQSNDKYKIPTEYCSSDTDTVIGFDSPHNHDKIGSGSEPVDVNVKLTVVSSKDTEWIKIWLDDKLISDGNNKYVNVTSAAVATGTHKLKGVVRLKNGDQKETEITIGVNQVWDYVSPTPSSVATASATPVPTP